MEHTPHLQRHPYLTRGHGYINHITELSFFFPREAEKSRFLCQTCQFLSVLIIADHLEVICLQPFHCKSQMVACESQCFPPFTHQQQDLNFSQRPRNGVNILVVNPHLPTGGGGISKLLNRENQHPAATVPSYLNTSVDSCELVKL